MTYIDELPAERLIPIKVLITDVDGVLTTGGICYNSSGEEIKTFDVKDGAGIKMWQKAGGKVAFLTGRGSPMVARRAAELSVDRLVMNAGEKKPVFNELLDAFSVKAGEVLYIGDDWPDIPCIKASGVGVAVNDATQQTTENADAVTRNKGGCAAVREVIDCLLKAQNKIEKLLENYL